MKKEYVKPEIHVYEIESQQLLAGSNPELYNEGPEDNNDLSF